jgi:Ca-activated chloride channel family protein
MTFHDPVWLLALLVLPAAIAVRRVRPMTVWLVPFAAAWQGKSIVPARPWALGLACAGLALLVIALARPQRREELRDVRHAGYDLMLAIDLSPSMLAEDYRRDGKSINRLEALRPVINAFIQRRPRDRIGIVVFSGRAYTLAPLTFDHGWLERQLGRLRVGLIEEGTALGDGLVVALTRLEQPGRQTAGKRDGAFVVLLTDGANNSGLFEPMEATEMAKERGVPVYTMAIGTNGMVNMPYRAADGSRRYRREMSDQDHLMLLWIATRTGGKFFAATRQGSIAEAFRAIDAAQKIEFRTTRVVVTAELFAWFAVPGVLLMLTAALLTRWRTLRLSLPSRAAIS